MLGITKKSVQFSFCIFLFRLFMQAYFYQIFVERYKVLKHFLFYFNCRQVSSHPWAYSRTQKNVRTSAFRCEVRRIALLVFMKHFVNKEFFVYHPYDPSSHRDDVARRHDFPIILTKKKKSKHFAAKFVGFLFWYS